MSVSRESRSSTGDWAGKIGFLGSTLTLGRMRRRSNWSCLTYQGVSCRHRGSEQGQRQPSGRLHSWHNGLLESKIGNDCTGGVTRKTEMMQATSKAPIKEILHLCLKLFET